MITAYRTYWTIKMYDIAGAPVNVNYSTYVPGESSSTNVILHAFDRNLHFILNGIDELSFTLYLDDPAAFALRPLARIVKVWRKVVNEAGTTVYEDDANYPAFAGVVSNTTKNGAANTMNVKAFSPLWRLQFHFHLLNHYLKTDPLTGLDWKQSRLMWKMIDLINNAFGVSSFTGISEGNFLGSDPTVAPYYIAKGSNTWANFYEDLMQRDGSPDIIPRYSHNDSNPILMFFDTDDIRGTNRTGDLFFSYRQKDGNDNLSDITEELPVLPGEFANYLWVIGQGGPNSGKVAVSEQVSGIWSHPVVGVYMKTVDRQEIKRLNALIPIATQEKLLARTPKYGYSLTMSPATNILYKSNDNYSTGDNAILYGMGDLLWCSATRGALDVDKAVRVYEVELNNSSNNIETIQPLVSIDHLEKFT